MAVHDGARVVGGTGAVRWRSPAAVVPALSWVAVVLVVVGSVVRAVVDALRGDPALPQVELAKLARLVDLDAEANLPAYFSCLLLVTTAAGFFLVAALSRSLGEPSWPLAVPGAVAAYLSVDELASLHENLGVLVRLAGVSTGRLFTWVVPGALLAAAVGAGLLVVARRLSPRLRRRLVVAGAVYLVGALGMEALGSLFAVVGPSGDGAAPVQPPAYLVVNTVEEGLELVGALLALRAVLSLLRVATTGPGLVVELDPEHPALRG